MKILGLITVILILTVASFFAKQPLDGLFAFMDLMVITVFIYYIVGEE